MNENREPVDAGDGQPAPEESTAATQLPVLEEQTQQLTQDQPVLPEGHILVDSEGHRYRIGSLMSQGEITRYRADALGDDGTSIPVIVMQATSDAALSRLRRVRDALQDAKSPMLSAARALITDDTSACLVIDDPGARSLSDALSSGMAIPKVINALTQVAAGLSSMHKAGWLHLGLRPEEIYLSRPVRIMGLDYICRVGETPEKPFYIPGYSAPELIEGKPADSRADVYSVGALLYRAVTGVPIAETGPDLMTWQPPRPVPGVPQILSSCLGEHDSRYPNMEALHQALMILSRRMQPQVSYSVAAASTIGLEPTRTTNQDAYAYVTSGTGHDEGEAAWAVASVIDGMGGMAAGEVASRTAAETLLSSAATDLGVPRNLSAAEQVDTVRNWMQLANRAVVDKMAARQARGGCTMVIACAVGARLAIAHVGDCRVYLIRYDEVTQLTRDHSLAVALAMEGQIEMHEVRNHPDRNMVTRSLGDRHPMPDHFIDTLEATTPKATMELQPEDILLLCSDGLWEPVLDSEMLDCLLEHLSDLQAAAADMVSIALERGAHDNATVLLLRLRKTSPWEEEVTRDDRHNAQST